MTEPLPEKTPLYERHVALGARMIEFGGWLMPGEYTGIIQEHKTVRGKAGLFDLSHMGELSVRDTGLGLPDTIIAGDGQTPDGHPLPAATAFLNWVLTRRVDTMKVGDVTYSPLCARDGGIVDDILAYRRAQDFLLVVNAANITKNVKWLTSLASEWTERGGASVTVEDLSSQTALLAVQGPAAEQLLKAHTPADLTQLAFYQSVGTSVGGHSALVSRTGYTGEDGFEIYLHAQDAGTLWDFLLRRGRSDGLVPVGLGARDTLRLEARLLLYGNDIDESTHPLEAGLKWAVDFDKPDFVGREALLRYQEQGLRRRLVAFEMIERGIPRTGYPVLAAGGGESSAGEPSPIGRVTSGTHSPTLNRPIGLGYVSTPHAKPGTTIAIDVRGRQRKARIIKGRFLPPKTKR